MGATGRRGVGSTCEMGARDEVMVESAVVLSLGGPASGVSGPGGVVGFGRVLPTRKRSRKAGAADFAVFLFGGTTGDAKSDGEGLEWAGGKK